MGQSSGPRSERTADPEQREARDTRGSPRGEIAMGDFVGTTGVAEKELISAEESRQEEEHGHD